MAVQLAPCCLCHVRLEPMVGFVYVWDRRGEPEDAPTGHNPTPVFRPAHLTCARVAIADVPVPVRLIFEPDRI